MSKPVVAPGEYSLTEVSELFHVSRKTAERYVSRYKLQTVELIRFNKQVAGVVLTDEIIAKIQADNQMSIPGLALVETSTTYDKDNGRTDDSTLLDEYRTRMEVAETRSIALQDEINLLREILSEERVKNARLENQVENTQLIIDGLKARLDDKEKLIEAVQRQAEAERTRGDSINNQLSNAHARLQKLPDQNQVDDLKGWMEAALEKQQAAIEERLKLQQKEIAIKVEQELVPASSPKKGFNLFGFRISKE